MLRLSVLAWPHSLNSSTLHDLEIYPQHVTREGMIGRSALAGTGALAVSLELPLKAGTLPEIWRCH